MPIATQQAVESLLGRVLTSPEVSRLPDLLKVAAAQIASATGLYFSPVASTTVRLTCTRGEIQVPFQPVTALTVVTIDPTNVAATLSPLQYRLEGRVLVLGPGPWQRADISPAYLTVNLAAFDGQVDITLAYGMTTPPDDISFAAATAVAATFRQQVINAANPTGALLETLDDAETRYAPADFVLATGVILNPGALAAIVTRYGAGAWSPKVGR